MSENKDIMISVRATRQLREAFNRKAEEIGVVADVHREIIEAFIEDRLTISPPTVEKHPMRKLYNVT